MEPYIGFHETMSGVYTSRLDKDQEKKFAFTVDATAPLRKFVNPLSNSFMVTHLDGVVTMKDVCEGLPIQEGVLRLDFLRTHSLDYQFCFFVDGREYAYRGSKDLDLLQPVHTMTTLNGHIEVYEGKKTVDFCRSVCKFDLGDLSQFLHSFLQGLGMK
ncbi:hypothetical protein GOV03_00840 [Candidatus Woesearchaeota archaeon]|nr:hypothetical protein [Candidatus Woesearchaeota archaeon]